MTFWFKIHAILFVITLLVTLQGIVLQAHIGWGLVGVALALLGMLGNWPRRVP